MQVAAWRVRGKVPLAVDATAALLEVQMQDQMRHTRSSTARTVANSGLSHHALRLQYALPLIRSVQEAGCQDPACCEEADLVCVRQHAYCSSAVC